MCAGLLSTAHQTDYGTDFLQAGGQMRLQIMFTDYETHSFDYFVRQLGNHKEGLPETASPHLSRYMTSDLEPTTGLMMMVEADGGDLNSNTGGFTYFSTNGMFSCLNTFLTADVRRSAFM